MSLSSATSPSLGAPRPRLGLRFGAVDAAAVARAEAALKSLSGQFGQWLRDEIDKLSAARAAIDAEGWTPATAEALYFRAHDLKGLGGTYEYPIVTRLAGSLCRLLDQSAPGTAPLALVDAHIHTIKQVVRDELREADHPVGGAQAEALEARVGAHLAG